MLLADPDHPIRKRRQLALLEARITGPRDIDQVMVARSIFKRLPPGTATFYPPRFRGLTPRGGDSPAGEWEFALLGMKAGALEFLEAEAEAMLIYGALQAVG
ncbi:MAG: hypothetical protein ACREN7_09050 [Candidatus Dormibacteria bacterium]